MKSYNDKMFCNISNQTYLNGIITGNWELAFECHVYDKNHNYVLVPPPPNLFRIMFTANGKCEICVYVFLKSKAAVSQL